MRYSFIQARSKNILKTDTKLWLVFTCVMMGGLLGGDYYLSLKAHELQTQETERKANMADLKSINKDLEKNLDELKFDVDKINDITTKNTLLKETVENIFDIVPDQIVLSRVELTTNTLVIQGFTPTKDVYEYMLYPPLKSIFKTTKTSFTPTAGGYIFVCVNRKDPVEEKDKHE